MKSSIVVLPKKNLKMNTLIKSLIFVMAIGLFSCSDDDENVLSIVGVYTLTQESVTGCADTADNATENKTCTASECETLTIAGNNTFSVVEIDNNVSSSIDGTYALNGNQITFTYTFNGVTDTDVATYSQNGSTLVLTFEAEDDGCVESDTFTKK